MQSELKLIGSNEQFSVRLSTNKDMHDNYPLEGMLESQMDLKLKKEARTRAKLRRDARKAKIIEEIRETKLDGFGEPSRKRSRKALG